MAKLLSPKVADLQEIYETSAMSHSDHSGPPTRGHTPQHSTDHIDFGSLDSPPMNIERDRSIGSPSPDLNHISPPMNFVRSASVSDFEDNHISTIMGAGATTRDRVLSTEPMSEGEDFHEPIEINDADNDQKRQKKKKKMIIIIASFILLLIIVAIILVIILTSSTSGGGSSSGDGAESNVGSGSTVTGDTAPPTSLPSFFLTAPTAAPLQSDPTAMPTIPSLRPTAGPTTEPSGVPSDGPTTAAPSKGPSEAPTRDPSDAPTATPTAPPSRAPTERTPRRNYTLSMQIPGVKNAQSYSNYVHFAILGTLGLSDFAGSNQFTKRNILYEWIQEFDDVGNALGLVILRHTRSSLITTGAGVDGAYIAFTRSYTLSYKGGGPAGGGCSYIAVNLTSGTVYDGTYGDDRDCDFEIYGNGVPSLEPTPAPTSAPSPVPSDAPSGTPLAAPTAAPTTAPSGKPTYEPTRATRIYSLELQLSTANWSPSYEEFVFFAIWGDSGKMTEFKGSDQFQTIGQLYAWDEEFYDVGNPERIVVIKPGPRSLKFDGVGVDGLYVDFGKTIVIEYDDATPLKGTGCSYVEANVLDNSYVDASKTYNGFDDICPYNIYENGVPSLSPTPAPTAAPTGATDAPTSLDPTATPTGSPTPAPVFPTDAPTGIPTDAPTGIPTNAPTGTPTSIPTGAPTLPPTAAPITSRINYTLAVDIPDVSGAQTWGHYVYFAIVGERGTSRFEGTNRFKSKNKLYEWSQEFEYVGNALGLVVLRHVNRGGGLTLSGAGVSGVFVNFDENIKLIEPGPPNDISGGCSYVYIDITTGSYFDGSKVSTCPYDIYLDGVPSVEPTPSPSVDPTRSPSPAPTDAPTARPTRSPTDAPTNVPSPGPTREPSDAPTDVPTDDPTKGPSPAPSDAPSKAPTPAPSDAPTRAPTDVPTDAPSETPTESPTDAYRDYTLAVQLSSEPNSQSYANLVYFAVEGEYGLSEFRATDRFKDEGTRYEWTETFENVGQVYRLYVFRHGSTTLVLTGAGVDGAFVDWGYDITLQYSHGPPSQGTGCSFLVADFVTNNVDDQSESYRFLRSRCPYDVYALGIPSLEPTEAPTPMPTDATSAPTTPWPTLAPTTHDPTLSPTLNPTFSGSRKVRYTIKVDTASGGSGQYIYFAVIGKFHSVSNFRGKNGLGGKKVHSFNLWLYNVGPQDEVEGLIIVHKTIDNLRIHGAGVGDQYYDWGHEIALVNFESNPSLDGMGCSWVEVSFKHQNVTDGSTSDVSKSSYCPYDVFGNGVPTSEPVLQPTVDLNFCGGARYETKIHTFSNGDVPAVLVEAEDMNSESDYWVFSNRTGDDAPNSDWNGRGYIFFDHSDQYSYGGDFPMTVNIRINHPGLYRFVVRGQTAADGKYDEHNDIWLRFDADDYYGYQFDRVICPANLGESAPCLQGRSMVAAPYTGWFKMFKNSGTGFGWQATLDVNHEYFSVAARFDEVGIYAIEFAGRSYKFWLDRLLLFQLINGVYGPDPTEEEFDTLGPYDFLCSDIDPPV